MKKDRLQVYLPKNIKTEFNTLVVRNNIDMTTVTSAIIRLIVEQKIKIEIEDGRIVAVAIPGGRIVLDAEAAEQKSKIDGAVPS